MAGASRPRAPRLPHRSSRAARPRRPIPGGRRRCRFALAVVRAPAGAAERPVVISSTTRWESNSDAGPSPTIWPSRSTAMRSATAKTSLRLCEIMMTASPWSASRRTSLSTCPVCATPSAAVGSSRMTSLEFHITALATAIDWRWPPESEATAWRDRAERGHLQARQRLGRGALHVVLVEQRRSAAARGRGTCSGRRRDCRTARGPGRRPRCRAPRHRAGCGCGPPGLPRGSRRHPVRGCRRCI